VADITAAYFVNPSVAVMFLIHYNRLINAGVRFNHSAEFMNRKNARVMPVRDLKKPGRQDYPQVYGILT
jgi:hypothetical protein